MQDKKSSVVVVVPIYTTRLRDEERLSLERTMAVLGHHPVAIVCPEGLDLAPLSSVFPGSGPQIERFEKKWFDGVAGYNRLMLSIDFYERFDSFDFVLICQTDVFVFDDRLMEWVARGYDYVGAPWIGSAATPWRKALRDLANLFRKKKKRHEHRFKVGNGGFSLRSVPTMLRIVRELRDDIDHELAHPSDQAYHVEDQYFSLVAPRKLQGGMNIPEWREALDFCIDRRPLLGLRLNGGRLPFACHGFDKRNVRKFWRPLLEKVMADSASH